MPPTSFTDLRRDTTALAGAWRAERAERQARRGLDPSDFAQLRDAGFLLAVVPRDQGGLWDDISTSARPLCETLRTLAGADASVALVAATHPAVLGYWLGTDGATSAAWSEQRRAVFATAATGRQWGTITSEPGSGGDVLRTRTTAIATGALHPELPGRCHLLTGDKHFGSGFGISDFMFTTARVDGEDGPSAYVLDMAATKAGGDPAIVVTAEWDGAGMAATQSHGARLESAPAARLAFDGPIEVLVANAGPFVLSLFSAVILGVLDEAVTLARTQLGAKRADLRPFEQVEWTRAELEHWLATQAYEGGLRAVEAGDPGALGAVLRAKTAIAELAESSLRRITTVLGGGTFSRRSPFASWFEDVRALGFLRPPWGLAFDGLYATSLD